MLVDTYQSTNHLPSHKSSSVIHCFHPPCILELRTELIQWQTDFRGISYFILGHLDTSGQPDKFIGKSMHFEFNLWFSRQVDSTNMASINSYLDIDIHTHKIHTFVNTLTNTHSQIRWSRSPLKICVKGARRPATTFSQLGGGWSVNLLPTTLALVSIYWG